MSGGLLEVGLMSIRVISAATMPILDCDETFNYWEPTIFAAFGRGMQTWEYAPDYALRSWLYVYLHAAPLKFFGMLGLDTMWNSRAILFYLP